MNRMLLAVLVLAVVYQVFGESGAQDGLMREVHQALGRKPGLDTRTEDHFYCGAVLEQNREVICGVVPSFRASQRDLFAGKEAASGFLKRGIQGLGEECCVEGCSVEEIAESC